MDSIMDTSSYLSTSTADTNEREAGKLSLDKEIRVLYDEFKKKGGEFSEASVGIVLDSDSEIESLGEELHLKMETYKKLFKKITDNESKYFKKHFVKKGGLVLYNSSHGKLIPDKIEDKIPPEVSKFFRKKPHNKRITFYIHNRADLFETILPGIFTIGEEQAFKIDQREFKKYLKITFLSDGSVIKEVYDIKQSKYVRVDYIPDIEFTYNYNGFNMGVLNAVIDLENQTGFSIDMKTTGFHEENESLEFPLSQPLWEYDYDNFDDEKEEVEEVKMRLIDNSEKCLLDSCLKTALFRVPEYFLPETDIYIYNSTCLFSNEFYKIINEFPEWYRIYSEQINETFSYRIDKYRRQIVDLEERIETRKKKIKKKEKQRDKEEKYEKEGYMARVYDLDAEIEKIKSVMNKKSEKLKKYKESFNGLLGDKRKLERNGIFTAVKVNPLEMGRKRSKISVVSGGRKKNSRRKNSRRKNSRRKNSRRKNSRRKNSRRENSRRENSRRKNSRRKNSRRKKKKII